MSPKSKVLVTGATGFIGGRLVERLFRETDVSVRCLVRNLGSATRLARLPVEIVRADLADPSDIDRAVQGVNYVFHCAYDRLSREQNVEGLRNLVAACATHKVRRLVYVSSYAVYEQVPDGPVTEETPEGDRSVPYVGAKLELEQMVLNMAGPLKVPATVVQPTIVYGPFCGTWTNDPAEKLIYGTVVLPDRGDGVCNAVYVDDVVDGLVLAALSSDAVGGRFILSGSHPITWATYFTEFARALKTNPPHYWPREQISKESRGIIPEIRRGLSDPRHIVTLLRRWEPVRQAMNAAVAAMPGTWQTHLRGYYKDGRLGETFLPPPELLAFYCLKGTAGIEKAHSILGYKPRFEFQTGMAPTGEYLRWAFGDLSRSVAARRAEAALKAHPRDVTGG